MQFLIALGYRLSDHPVSLKADNQGGIMLIINSEFHLRTKHIKVQHHGIQIKVDIKEIVIIYKSTKSIVADGLTKVLNS